MPEKDKPSESPGKPEPKKYVFLYEGRAYHSSDRTVTGAIIKSIIGEFPPGYQLFMESPGDEPDEQIRDDQSVDLEKDQGPRRFFAVPPANFGAA